LFVLKDRKHFAFGKNWDLYSRQINPQHVENSKKDLIGLIQFESLEGMTVLDIGSGSGIHSLSMMLLGCRDLVSLDYDSDSVSTTKRILSDKIFKGDFQVIQADILKHIPELDGRTFDLVYSWGVLHHTGDMMKGIDRSIGYVKPGGLIALALYRKTLFCSIWRIEKLVYSKSPKFLQNLIQKFYELVFALQTYLKTGKTFGSYKRGYLQKRGMEFSSDVHDWLGGYPYESIDPKYLIKYMEQLGFTMLNSHIAKKQIGILGSGCDEFLFKNNG
jgi:2-polyprenyl-6-hydroxyphenyl methylase/3-demethylubiquinone-9 3-methyltransferase